MSLSLNLDFLKKLISEGDRVSKLSSVSDEAVSLWGGSVNFVRALVNQETAVLVGALVIIRALEALGYRIVPPEEKP